MNWRSQTALAVRAVTVAGICLLAAGSSQSLPGSKSAGSSDQQLEAIVRAYVARTMALQPIEEIKVDLEGPDGSGLRRAMVHLGSAPSQVTATFYITADGSEVLRGTLDKLSVDPWSEFRLKLQPVLSGSPSTGPRNAAVTIVEFGDFQCPYCQEMNSELDRLLKVFPGRLRWVFADFPLQVHLWSKDAAAAGGCVAAQGSAKFWMFEHLVYDHQMAIKRETARPQLHDFAVQVGVEPGPYSICVSSPETAQRVAASTKLAQELGVANTPTLFVNGRKLAGAISFDDLKAVVENELTLSSDKASLATTR